MTSAQWLGLTQQELDFQLSPSKSAKNAAGVLDRHTAQTTSTLEQHHHRVIQNLVYGERPANRIDLVCPHHTTAAPCLVFLHGGFWQEGSKAGSGFAADTMARHGWATAMAGYTLAPQISLQGIINEVADALIYLKSIAPKYAINPDKLFVAGHSAGAYLAAALLCQKSARPAADAIAGAVLISGVYDLAPVAASYVNNEMAMSDEDVFALSVHQSKPMHDIPLQLIVGADEPAAFIDQTNLLATEWSQHLTSIKLKQVPGCDHFDILDELADTGSDTFRQLINTGAV